MQPEMQVTQGKAVCASIQLRRGEKSAAWNRQDLRTKHTHTRTHTHTHTHTPLLSSARRRCFAPPGGRTNTAAALNLLRLGVFNGRGGDRPDTPNFAVVVTDGESNIARVRGRGGAGRGGELGGRVRRVGWGEELGVRRAGRAEGQGDEGGVGSKAELGGEEGGAGRGAELSSIRARYLVHTSCFFFIFCQKFGLDCASALYQ